MVITAIVVAIAATVAVITTSVVVAATTIAVAATITIDANAYLCYYFELILFLLQGLSLDC